MSDIHSSELIHLWRPPTLDRPGIDSDLFDVVYKSNKDAWAEIAASDSGFDFDPEMMLADRIEPFEIDLMRLYGMPCTVLSRGVQILIDDEWRPVDAGAGRGLGVRGHIGQITALEYVDDPRTDYGFEVLDARVCLDGLAHKGTDYRTELAFQPIIDARLLKYVETVDFAIDPTEVPEQ